MSAARRMPPRWLPPTLPRMDGAGANYLDQERLDPSIQGCKVHATTCDPARTTFATSMPPCVSRDIASSASMAGTRSTDSARWTEHHGEEQGQHTRATGDAAALKGVADIIAFWDASSDETSSLVRGRARSSVPSQPFTWRGTSPDTGSTCRSGDAQGFKMISMASATAVRTSFTWLADRRGLQKRRPSVSAAGKAHTIQVMRSAEESIFSARRNLSCARRGGEIGITAAIPVIKRLKRAPCESETGRRGRVVYRGRIPSAAKVDPSCDTAIRGHDSTKPSERSFEERRGSRAKARTTWSCHREGDSPAARNCDIAKMRRGPLTGWRRTTKSGLAASLRIPRAGCIHKDERRAAT